MHLFAHLRSMAAAKRACCAGASTQINLFAAAALAGGKGASALSAEEVQGIRGAMTTIRRFCPACRWGYLNAWHRA
jgi:hypothetical protein